MRRQFVCVDLAGSERILKSGVEGLAQKQAVGINSSLTTLGKVVKAVGERSAQPSTCAAKHLRSQAHAQPSTCAAKHMRSQAHAQPSTTKRMHRSAARM